MVSNYVAALQAIIHVKGLGYESNNRSWIDDVGSEASGALGVQSNIKYGAHYGELLAALGRNDEPNEISNVLAPVLAARDTRFANCEGRSALAFLYLIGLKKFPVAMIGIGNDHVFLVIGRTSGSIADYTTWNADAIICDPWAEEAYKASDLSRRIAKAPLMDVVGSPPVTSSQMCEYTGAWPPASLRDICTTYGF